MIEKEDKSDWALLILYEPGKPNTYVFGDF